MSRKKDCFGLSPEEYNCRTPNCPYLKSCLIAIHQPKIERRLDKDWKQDPSSIILYNQRYYNDKDGILRSRDLSSRT